MNIEIASTRFSDDSLNQNQLYKSKNKISGVIYGSPLKIRDKYPENTILFVIEMNTDTNKINGIGIIRNKINFQIKKNIYSNFNWNRFIYTGNYWISRENLMENEKDLLEKLEICLFKGKSHLKRLSGITIITKKNYERWEIDSNEFKRRIKNLFLQIHKKD